MRRAIIAALAVLALFDRSAVAQNYPDRTVRIIVPYAAGGATDVYARMLGQNFTSIFGQQFIIENRAGAAQIIGAEAAARSPKDGYTLFFATAAVFTSNPMLYKTLGYKVEDFAPISLIGTSPYTLTARTSLEAKTLPEIVEYARKNPGALKIGSLGQGSGPYLVGKAIESAYGIKFIEVPYKGSSDVAVDLLGGRIDLYPDGMSGSLDLERNGGAKIVAVMDSRRSPAVPNAPSIAELGKPDLILTNWFGLFVPAGVPQDIIDKLNAATVKAVASADFRAKLTAQGVVPESSTPAEVARIIKEETAFRKKLIEAFGIQPQ